MKIKVNDNILVIAGKNQGKTGRVTRVYKKTDRITVEKINMRTRHVRKTQTQPGEKIVYEAPFHASNVKIICPECHKAVRAGYQVAEKGKKQRICKKCNAELDKLEQRTKKTTRRKK